MEVTIYFSIIANDGFDIGVRATATLSGKYVPATFNHDIEDDRECMVNEIDFFGEDGEETISGSEELNEIVYKHVENFSHRIYADAELGRHKISIADFKTNLNYAKLI
jgi:hypothetical protein